MKCASHILLFFFGVMSLMACSRSDSPTKQPNANEPSVNYVRPGSEGGNTAAYFSYINPLNIPDTLISVSADYSSISQVHESYKTEDGLYGMREVKKPVIGPNDTLHLQQGGTHIMLIGLRQNLASGDSVEVKLEFSQSGGVIQRLPVRSNR